MGKAVKIFLVLFFLGAAVEALLWAKQELSYGGQFDLESIAFIGFLFTPIVFLPFIVAFILTAAALAIATRDSWKD